MDKEWVVVRGRLHGCMVTVARLHGCFDGKLSSSNSSSGDLPTAGYPYIQVEAHSEELNFTNLVTGQAATEFTEYKVKEATAL